MKSHGGGDEAVWVMMGMNVERCPNLVSNHWQKESLLFSVGLLSSPTPTNEMWSILPLQIHPDIHTWLVKISSLASSQRHNTHHKTLLTVISANFFCSLGIFSFILFRSVQVGATCALVKLLTWMALSVSVWLDTSENSLLCCRGIWLFLPASQKLFSNPKCLCK